MLQDEMAPMCLTPVPRGERSVMAETNTTACRNTTGRLNAATVYDLIVIGGGPAGLAAAHAACQAG